MCVWRTVHAQEYGYLHYVQISAFHNSRGCLYFYLVPPALRCCGRGGHDRRPYDRRRPHGTGEFLPFPWGALVQPFLGYLIERQGNISWGYTLQDDNNSFWALVICMIIAHGTSLFIPGTMEKHKVCLSV